VREGKALAYVFDFGDEWRLLLKIVDRWKAGDETYPMLVEAEGCRRPSTRHSRRTTFPPAEALPG
jgi:hypothetical protein